MYSSHNRDDFEKLENLQETKSLLHKERIKVKLGKQDFHYDMEEDFEPVTFKQQGLSEKQLQALRDSTRAASQTTVQAIENQTQAIRESSNALNKNVQNPLNKEYKNMMKFLIVKISSLQVLLIPTKLILVSLRQFPTFLMTKTKVNLV